MGDQYKLQAQRLAVHRISVQVKLSMLLLLNSTQQRLKCNGMRLSYLLMALHVVVEAHYILLQMHAHLEWVMESSFSSGSSSPDKGTYVFTALSTRPYQHFIKDLTHNGTYYVRILAYNAVGPG